MWAGEDAEPVADPVAPSGVTVPVPAGNPWAAAGATDSACPVPSFNRSGNERQTAAEPFAAQPSADSYSLTASAESVDPFAVDGF
jgi:putative DNA primase/helicase